MKLFLDIDIPLPAERIQHQDKIMLVGSCFTQHIGNKLAELKFSTLQNPNGILFDALSVSRSLLSYIDNKPVEHEDLFFLNELWQSWQHHSLYSGLQQQEVLDNINHSKQQAHTFLQQADWLIITLGTSFSYRLQQTGESVANCHRAPAPWFHKHLVDIEEMRNSLEDCIRQLSVFNKKLKIIFTISPVRHTRDGVVENNRSKARLIEAVHHVADLFSHVYYFPAYELVIDVLRDYRFYDIDLVHPNYAATDFVFNKFADHYIEPSLTAVLEEIKKINTAFRHKPSHPATAAHTKFVENTLSRIHRLQHTHGYIDFEREVAYFGGEGVNKNLLFFNKQTF